MASKNGDQSPTKDPNDTSSPVSEADSGLGSLAAQDVENLEEEPLTLAVEPVSDNGGSQSMLQESYDQELWRLEGKKASKLTIKGIYERSISVSESTFEISTPGTVSDDVRSGYEDEAAVRAAEGRTLTYSDRQEVPSDIWKNLRSKGEGKTHEVGKVYSALADHLRGVEKAEDCYLLPIENGLLISPKEITTFTDNTPGSIVRVEQEPRRGVFMTMETAVSKDRDIAYRPGQQAEGGNFLVLTEVGDGIEAIVYKAMDVRTGDKFAVKKMEISERMREWKDPLSGFLKLPGCEQTCRAYGVIVDEADNCVYFLMELLEGKTLMALLGDQTVPIGIPFAVDYTIHILEGLKYIHSKGMVHADINGRNIMIVGPNAIIVDTTGAREASSPRSLGYVWDVKNAINLLNNMLRNDDSESSQPPWEASDKDRKKFDKGTIDKLQCLLKNKSQYLVPLSTTSNKFGKLLQDLQEISKELEGRALIYHLQILCTLYLYL
ncbi:uncharacterized protein [Branchiostoma lanceolatum]|uniref:uncharacterized protein n=1 Tax=Branchiostoma lanceolatum TaxID=7740 RepID=UPI003452FE71